MYTHVCIQIDGSSLIVSCFAHKAIRSRQLPALRKFSQPIHPRNEYIRNIILVTNRL